MQDVYYSLLTYSRHHRAATNNKRHMRITGRKNYARALELFMLGLTAPSMVKSAIALAIYKKHVLVSLIHLGKQPAVCCSYTISIAVPAQTQSA
jgi:hypothetical protein